MFIFEKPIQTTYSKHPILRFRISPPYLADLLPFLETEIDQQKKDRGCFTQLSP
jgi:hypothetical protein